MARSRFQRSMEDLPPFRPTQRDDDILLTLSRLKYCLVEHIAALHFSSVKRASERLMVLYQHRWADRLFLPAERGQARVVHVLGQLGATRLHQLGHDDARAVRARRQRTTLFLDHELAVATTLTQFLAASAPGIMVSCAERASGELADAFVAERVRHVVRPDGAIVLDGQTPPTRTILLLEVDRGTMSIRQMRAKFRAYRAWFTQRPERAAATMRSLLERHRASASATPAQTRIAVVASDARRSRALAKAAVAEGLPRLLLAEERALVESGPLGRAWTGAAALANGESMHEAIL